jgi:hypothetical protein
LLPATSAAPARYTRAACGALPRNYKYVAGAASGPHWRPLLSFTPPRSAAQAADASQLVRFADLDDIYVSVNSPEEIPEAIEQITMLLRLKKIQTWR